MTTPKQNDGGPAFPHAVQALHSSYAKAIPGMSLRDWFAGQALAASDWASWESDNDHIAKRCYMIADAMIAERERGKQ